MFNKNIKLITAAGLISFAIYLFIIGGNIGNGIFLLLISSLFILFYFKNELIILSFLQLRKQNFDGAKKYLDKISNPETALVKKQQGYYNYLNGLMVSQTNLNQAEKYFRKAIELGFKDQSRLNNDANFNSLKTNSKFLELLEKTN